MVDRLKKYWWTKSNYELEKGQNMEILKFISKIILIYKAEGKNNIVQ